MVISSYFLSVTLKHSAHPTSLVKFWVILRSYWLVGHIFTQLIHPSLCLSSWSLGVTVRPTSRGFVSYIDQSIGLWYDVKMWHRNENRAFNCISGDWSCGKPKWMVHWEIMEILQTLACIGTIQLSPNSTFYPSPHEFVKLKQKKCFCWF